MGRREENSASGVGARTHFPVDGVKPGATVQMVVFSVEGQLHALRLHCVERVTTAAQVTPLPGAPGVVLGAIDLAGRILPVLSLRRRLGLADRALRPSDAFLVARTARRSVALLVDAVEGVRASAAPVVDASTLAPGLRTVQGVVRLDDGLLLIHDLEAFLSGAEERALQSALRDAG
jgi:purine-binding chemotaxis protein CheW